MGWSTENIEGKKKTDRRKPLNSEKKEKRIIRAKSNNKYKHLWFYLSHKALYFSRKHSLKKVVYTIELYLQFLCVAIYFKRSNYTLNLNIHKYANSYK